ncbi:MAG TPA: hypothetical protein PKN33_06050 [Phycisphaerae bacterium]|nr:hypothetical protein [Phycisphaerae bacterium]
MTKWIDTVKAGDAIKKLFADNKQSIAHFGQTVNQVFEAFTFCAVIKWYEQQGWKVEIVNPIDTKTKKTCTLVKLKFSTRGRPSSYSYARCSKDGQPTIEVRHQLRVSTHHYRGGYPLANICLDVAIVQVNDGDLDFFGTDDALPNSQLLSFGEAKHMSAYAELVASFIGMVHELQPLRLKCIRRGKWSQGHVAPFLYVSGHLYSTAKGIYATIRRRKYDIDVYCDTVELAQGFKLPKHNPPAMVKTPVTTTSGGGGN